MQNSKKIDPTESVSINPTQLLFNYLYATGGKTEYARLFSDLDEIVIALKNEKIKSNVVFHGCRTDGNIRGETISNELWYWVSNNFIDHKHEREKIILEFSDKIKPEIRQHINWNLSEKTISILNDVITKKISDPTLE